MRSRRSVVVRAGRARVLIEPCLQRRTAPGTPDLLRGYQADNDDKHSDSCGEQWRIHGLPPSGSRQPEAGSVRFSAPAWRFGSPAWLRFVVQFKLLPEYTRPTG